MKLSKGRAAAGGGRARVLVTVTTLGSAGPLRFLVDDGETVTGLIRAALRCYAREGRMPLLGTDPAGFLLYNANGRSDALKSDERISFDGCRSFLLWQNARQGVFNEAGSESEPLSSSSAASSTVNRKVSGGWKDGLNKFLLSLSIKV